MKGTDTTNNFWRYDISSTRHFINSTFCQLDIFFKSFIKHKSVIYLYSTLARKYLDYQSVNAGTATATSLVLPNVCFYKEVDTKLGFTTGTCQMLLRYL